MEFFVTERGRVVNIEQIVEIEFPNHNRRHGNSQMSNGTYVELSVEDCRHLAGILADSTGLELLKITRRI